MISNRHGNSMTARKANVPNDDFVPLPDSDELYVVQNTSQQKLFMN